MFIRLILFILVAPLFFAAAGMTSLDADEEGLQTTQDSCQKAAADVVPELLLSRQLMESEEFMVGDLVRFSTHASGEGACPFRIVGMYEPTPDPLRLGAARLEARLHLPDLIEITSDPQDPMASETVSAINVALTNSDEVHEVADELSARVSGIKIQSTATESDSSETFVVIEHFHLAVALVTVIASTVFLLLLMVIRTEERRETIGIFRLIGMTRKRVLLHVFMEGFLVAVLGTLFGIVLSVAVQDVFNQFFQWRYDTVLVFVRITSSVVIRTVALAVPLGILSSIVASWLVLRHETLKLVRR